MYAPWPRHRLSSIFSTKRINRYLEGLIKAQKGDGRWNNWYGLGEGMKIEWAGIQTLWSLNVLKAYGKIDHKKNQLGKPKYYGANTHQWGTQ